MLDNLIEAYFSLGLHYNEILYCLQLNHNFNISIRTLKRKLKNRNLFRRKSYTDLAVVCNFIRRVLSTHGQLHGYRWLHLKCVQNNMVVTHETVRLLLHLLDPQGVSTRSRKRLRRREYFNKGPNFLWHMDCYDKLKPYGICISGCIDGFSRQIMWLRAGTNTNDPRIICSYYFDAVKEHSGCPRTVRADFGTENGVVEQLQTCLRRVYGTDSSMPAFIYGTSTHNQRIESWWAILRKHFSQFWMNLFQDLKNRDFFNGSFLDKSLIQFCFLPIIQVELDTVALEWSMHRLTSSRNSVSPSGRPFIMYNMPQMYQTKDYMCHLPIEVIQECEGIRTCPNRKPCDPLIYELTAIIMYEKSIPLPKTPQDAKELYLILREEINSLIA